MAELLLLHCMAKLLLLDCMAELLLLHCMAMYVGALGLISQLTGQDNSYQVCLFCAYTSTAGDCATNSPPTTLLFNGVTNYS